MSEKINTEDQAKININWYPGHMAKTKREISELMPLIDIVYELVDARIPFSSKIKDVDSLIKNKIRVLIMTKKDLCDLFITNKWVAHYENQGYNVLLLDLNNPNDYKKILDLTGKLVKDINDKRIKKGMREKEIKALVLGVPNVGKSTLINKMVGRKVANVGNIPGVTKNKTWLKTSNNILLLDTPGILWPKLDNETIGLNLASMTAIKHEVLPLDDVACYILKTLDKYYPHILKERYDMDHLSDDFLEVYDHLARKCGALLKGGEPDYIKIDNTIVNDIKNEYIKGITFDRGV